MAMLAGGSNFSETVCLLGSCERGECNEAVSRQDGVGISISIAFRVRLQRVDGSVQ